MAKQRKGFCRCDHCLFFIRKGWWKRILIERDITKETKEVIENAKGAMESVN